MRHYEASDWTTVADVIGVASPDAARMLYARAITELAKQMRKKKKTP